MTPTQHALTGNRSRPSWLAAACLTAALFVAGCSSLAPVAVPPSVDRATQLANQGNHVAAAEMYARLAASTAPADSLALGVSAAREWLAANRPDDAQRTLAGLLAPTDPRPLLDLRLLEVEVQLARAQPAEAWRLVAALPEPKPPLDVPRYLALRERAAFAAGRATDAVRAGVALDRLATTDAERMAGRRELLSQLRKAVERGVKLDPQAVREAPVRGWLELGAIAANAARSPLNAARDIERWRGRNPGHPGSTIAMTEIMGPTAPSTLGSVAGTQIAVLLPLAGRQATAATLVRDGFLAAVSQLPEGQRPVVKVYDTGELSVAAALAAAQAEGASFIVGPLTREEAIAAVNENTRRTPMLLLNNLPPEQGSPANVWQFALSPEDEARQVAQRALALGQRRAIILAPSGDWGTRVVAAFRETLLAGGGSVLVQASYDPARSEFTAPITEALRIDESRARHKRVEEIVGGKLNFEPRRRADIDFIFAAGQPVALRQIRPQLRFFYAGDVPTYMTSDAYDPDPGANRDIDGMLFPDMPWMLQDQGPIADTRAATQAAWGDKGPRLPRLFAFGYDAGQLVLALRNPQWQWPLAGVTGRLSPDAQRRLRRDLDWAQVRNGKPVLLGLPSP